MSNLFAGKRVLVTGGTGMIGTYLAQQLLDRGARVRVASLDDPARANPGAEFMRADLTRWEDCLSICAGMNVVFHLAGIKGSPAMAAQRPASFFVPILLMNTNMMEAARQAGVERYLYTSTIGVYPPAEVFREDDAWTGFPSDNDRFAGWAKRMGELQAQAYRIEHGWRAVSIVRPANVYGRHDNFDPSSAMVVPSLISRALAGEDPLHIWGDGSPVRDFIHASDVARGMLLVMESGTTEPVNLGSGQEVSIKDLAERILACLSARPRVIWDRSKPSGDKRRVMDISRAKALGFKPSVTIEQGIADTIEWYRKHRAAAPSRYNVFDQSEALAGQKALAA